MSCDPRKGIGETFEPSCTLHHPNDYRPRGLQLSPHVTPLLVFHRWKRGHTQGGASERCPIAGRGHGLASMLVTLRPSPRLDCFAGISGAILSHTA